MPRVRPNRWSSLANTSQGSPGPGAMEWGLGKGTGCDDIPDRCENGRYSKLTPGSLQNTPAGIRQAGKLKWFRLHLTFISGFGRGIVAKWQLSERKGRELG